MTEATQGGPEGEQESQNAPPGTDPTPASAEPANEPQGPPEAQGPPEGYSYEHVHALREENERHRLRFRESEEARAALQARLDAADRREIERIAADRLNEPNDVWLIYSPADFRAEDGSLDEQAVRERIDQLTTERPHWAKPVPGYDGGVRRSAEQQPSFGSALKQRVSGGT